MNYSVNPADQPVIVRAGRAHFLAGEVYTNRHVESRALIWKHTGSGSLETDGRTIDVTESSCVFLPWRHTEIYRAAATESFTCSGLHLIPWHDPQVPVELDAAHGRRDRLAGVAYRRDVDWPDIRGVVEITAEPGDRLLTIANFAVDHFQRGHPDPMSVRALAMVLLNELRAALAQPRRGHRGIPPRLATST